MGIYQPYAGLQYGRCIGHGAIPVFDSDAPYDVPAGLIDPPQLIADTRLPVNGGVYAHGYVMISLAGAVATVDYFQDASDTPSYSEKIGAPA